MGEVSNCLSTSWQMRSDVPPPLIPLSFSRMKRKDHTSKVSWAVTQRQASLLRACQAPMVLGPLAETKVDRPSGRTPAITIQESDVGKK